jgi:hypothetical protein
MWSEKSAVGAVISLRRTGEFVSAFLDRLPVEEAGELGKGLRLVVGGDRDVLMGGRELVGDLFVQGLDETIWWHRSPSGGGLRESLSAWRAMRGTDVTPADGRRRRTAEQR